MERTRLRWDGKLGMPPASWVRCYKAQDRYADIYAPRWFAPLVKLAHWYREHRWDMDRLALWWDRRSHGCWCSTLIREDDYYWRSWFYTGEWATPKPGSWHSQTCSGRAADRQEDAPSRSLLRCPQL